MGTWTPRVASDMLAPTAACCCPTWNGRSARPAATAHIAAPSHSPASATRLAAVSARVYAASAAASACAPRAQLNFAVTAATHDQGRGASQTTQVASCVAALLSFYKMLHWPNKLGGRRPDGPTCRTPSSFSQARRAASRRAASNAASSRPERLSSAASVSNASAARSPSAACVPCRIRLGCKDVSYTVPHKVHSGIYLVSMKSLFTAPQAIWSSGVQAVDAARQALPPGQ